MPVWLCSKTTSVDEIGRPRDIDSPDANVTDAPVGIGGTGSGSTKHIIHGCYAAHYPTANIADGPGAGSMPGTREHGLHICYLANVPVVKAADTPGVSFVPCIIKHEFKRD